jgi:hypothetical protein
MRTDRVVVLAAVTMIAIAIAGVPALAQWVSGHSTSSRR